MQKPNIARPPFYYVKKRLLSNSPAVFGMIVIVLAVLVSILGYSIMPDQTPYADERADQISKKPPGFKVKMIRYRVNSEVPKRSFFAWILFGQPSEYKNIPIENYRIDDNTLSLIYRIYGEGQDKRLPLVDVIRPVYVGNAKEMANPDNIDYDADSRKVRYADLEGKIRTLSRVEVIAEFEKKGIIEKTYWMGTDNAGRDMLSRLLFGVRISLGIGLISVVISFLVGITLGSLAGFFGGWVDNLILWFMTVVWSIPGIMLVIAISLALGRGIFVAFVAIGLTTWVEIARVVRGQIMSVKQKQYVEAARALGMRSHRIILVHIMPNILGPLIVILTSNFASAILTEAGLSFLGLSAQPPMASWGVMVNEGFGFITTDGGFYLVLFPSLCIAMMVLAFNLFGNGLRDAYDPKTSTRSR
ncbi:MAG: hypothetical protein OHK0053_35540 [Microscillaceae bacterium]